MTASPFALKNIRLFIAFRLFFNARFYYPVFTILFLDYGLTIEQFSLLNTVWAVTIVCAEVPSGALADIIGRKKLLLITSCCMILELGLIAFVPLGNSNIIFTAFLLNRILSGVAEAMASGADEAIAYDSLLAHGLAKSWPRVIGVQMRWRSIASIISVSSGAALYDAAAVNSALNYLGFSLQLSQQTTMRFPIYLTLVLAFLALAAVLMMDDPHKTPGYETGQLRQAFAKTMQAARWIAATPFALSIILIAMCYDHVLRMVVTMTSQYYRVIGLPDASFGLIGASMGLLGLITPKIAEYMAGHYRPKKNIAIIGGVALLGLAGLTTMQPIFGLLSMAFVFTGLNFTSFFTSHYLNAITSSAMRATVLSFKGLAFNLGYGAIGIVFALVMGMLRGSFATATSSTMAENLAFTEALSYFPLYLALLMLILFAILRRKIAAAPVDFPSYKD